MDSIYMCTFVWEGERRYIRFIWGWGVLNLNPNIWILENFNAHSFELTVQCNITGVTWIVYRWPINMLHPTNFQLAAPQCDLLHVKQMLQVVLTNTSFLQTSIHKHIRQIIIKPLFLLDRTMVRSNTSPL